MNINSTIRFFFPGFQILLLSILGIALTSNSSFAQVSPSDYVTIWQTDGTGDTGDDQIFFPAYGEYTIYYESVPAGISGTLPESGTFTDGQTLTFPAAGTYRVAVKPTGSNPFHQISFGDYDVDPYKIRAIEQWGSTVWSSMSFAYYDCEELITLPETDMPDLSSVTIMDWAFGYCYKLTGSSNMNDWDVSNVNDMAGMFADTDAFNQPIEKWDVSNVTIMETMFYYATAFNQPIGRWVVSSVTDMSGMFSDATNFNQPLVDWDVSAVTRMDYMFRNASNFNQPLADWDVSAVTRMDYMFRNASNFNQPLGGWDVSAVTRMADMFREATNFNQPLGNWNVSNVNRIYNMFFDATSFNQLLGNWTFKSDAQLDDLLTGSGMGCGNYNSTLIGWAANPATPPGRSFGAGGKIYGSPAVEARNVLISMGWTISGDSFDASCTSLPVTLVSFNAKRQEFSTLISWSTTEETNSDYFEIQRSLDTKNWKSIGTVAAAGESKNQQTYHFNDPAPVNGINYYRLQMVDKDKTFAYSRIHSAEFSAIPALSIYPNPASDRLLIENYTQVKRIEMFNAAGQKLLEKKRVTAQGLDLTQFSSGLHTVKVFLTDGSSRTSKLVISR